MHDASLPSEVNEQLEKMEVRIISMSGIIAITWACIPRLILFTTVLQVAVTELEAALNPLLGKDMKELEDQLEAISRAELHLVLAQATASLFGLLLKARGITTGMSKEQNRLQVYKRRVRKLAAQKELGPGRQRLQLDVSAVNRFIAATQDLTAEQKADLRAVSAKKEKKKEKKGRQQTGQGEETTARESKLKRQKHSMNHVSEEKRDTKKRTAVDPALAFLDEMRSKVETHRN
jgi:hypothetical protein